MRSVGFKARTFGEHEGRMQKLLSGTMTLLPGTLLLFATQHVRNAWVAGALPAALVIVGLNELSRRFRTDWCRLAGDCARPGARSSPPSHSTPYPKAGTFTAARSDSREFLDRVSA